MSCPTRATVSSLLVVALVLAGLAARRGMAKDEMSSDVSIAPRTATCAVPGEWPYTRDADWVVRMLRRAGFKTYGCTGSAFTIDLGRADLYVWAFTNSRLHAEPGMTTRVVAGVRVHLNRIRATWRAGRRNVWIEAGPATARLPPPRRWRRLVAFSLPR